MTDKRSKDLKCKRKKRQQIVKAKLEQRRQRLVKLRVLQKREAEVQAEIDKEARELSRLVKPATIGGKTEPAVFDRSQWSPKQIGQKTSISKSQGFDKSAWLKAGSNELAK
jgi:hypothetical protein